ncbi:hypothetical protein D9M69_694220 [compost metagenome]
MRAQGGLFGDGGLQDGKVLNGAIGIHRQFRLQRVDSGGFEPEPAPLVQVAAAGLLQF